jgi:N-acetylmuramoyl-L-alanine amidase
MILNKVLSKPKTNLIVSPLIYGRLGLTILLSCFGLQYGMAQLKLVDRPIVWNEKRLQLTKDYIESHYNIKSPDGTINPKIIVLHWTAIPDLESSYEAFKNATLPSARGDIAGGGALNVSAHYLIDRDGTIYNLMPDSLMARHTIGLNYSAIGVENVGGTTETPLTRKQVRANINLVKFLAEKYAIEYLIGHYEYTHFQGHPLWLEVDNAYRTQKSDPGPDFMKNVRRALHKLELKGAPSNH